MDWVSNLATAIAIFRLVLICCGMWIQLRTISRQGVLKDSQKRFFAIAGIIYLLGLMPQSLLLLLVSSDLVTAMLDSGYLCSAQKFVCMIAVGFHNLIFLHWLLKYTSSFENTILTRNIKRFVYISNVYVFVLILCRGYFMQNKAMLYTDIPSNSTVMTILPAQQVVRLQLLLCESSLKENQVLDYLIVSYAFAFLPFFLIGLIFKWRLCKKKEDAPDEITDKSTPDGWQQSLWWEREENIQRFLSTFITVWFHFIQPIIFCTHREHFVDFGVHLLLTVCVFIPWTLSEEHYNNLRSWV